MAGIGAVAVVLLCCSAFNFKSEISMLPLASHNTGATFIPATIALDGLVP